MVPQNCGSAAFWYSLYEHSLKLFWKIILVVTFNDWRPEDIQKFKVLWFCHECCWKGQKSKDGTWENGLPYAIAVDYILIDGVFNKLLAYKPTTSESLAFLSNCRAGLVEIQVLDVDVFCATDKFTTTISFFPKCLGHFCYIVQSLDNNFLLFLCFFSIFLSHFSPFLSIFIPSRLYDSFAKISPLSLPLFYFFTPLVQVVQHNPHRMVIALLESSRNNLLRSLFQSSWKWELSYWRIIGQFEWIHHSDSHCSDFH